MATLDPCAGGAADGSGTSISVCRVNEPVSNTPWTYLLPNEVGTWGASLDTTSSQPLSLDRMARKGTITSLSAEAQITCDQNIDMLAYFCDALLFAMWKGNNPNATAATAVTTSGYTVVSGGASFVQGDKVFAAGFDVDSNNGLKTVGSGSTSTNIAITGLTAETSGGRLYKAGRTATAGDIEMDANGNLTSTTMDFTTLGLVEGMHIGFSGVSGTADGTARIRDISANLLTLDRHSGVVAATSPAGAVTLYIGSFVRNVPMGDADYQCVPMTLEARYNTDPATFEYGTGMLLNQIAFGNSLEDKTTMELSFTGQDMEPMTETRKPGQWFDQTRTEIFNTSADFADLRLFITGDTSGETSYFKDTTLTVNNNLTGETVLGKLGPQFINLGNFEVTLETEVVLTDARVAAAIRNNTTCGLQYVQQNNEGSVLVDIPSMTLGDGARNIAAGEKVKISTTGTAFKDTELGYAVGFTLFPYLP